MPTGPRCASSRAGVDHDAFGDQFAGGSQSVRNGWAPLRHAGAVARALLIQAAAERWGVDAAGCSTARGVVRHAGSGRRAAYGTLTAAAARLPVPGAVKLKDASTFTLIGRPTRQRDTPDIVVGRARFGLDARVPGMRYACIERAPVFGARALTVDGAAARALGGVTDVISLEAETLAGFGDNNPRPVSGVAVIAASTWAALRGRRALKVSWSEGASGEDSAAPSRRMRAPGRREPRSAWCATTATSSGPGPRRGAEAAGGLRGAAARARAHGAHELPRRRACPALRGMGADPEPAGGARRSRRASAACRPRR